MCTNFNIVYRISSIRRQVLTIFSLLNLCRYYKQCASRTQGAWLAVCKNSGKVAQACLKNDVTAAVYIIYVAVPGRNRTLFHCVFRLRYRSIAFWSKWNLEVTADSHKKLRRTMKISSRLSMCSSSPSLSSSWSKPVSNLHNSLASFRGLLNYQFVCSDKL